LTWTSCKKHFHGVFELPSPRNAKKRAKKKAKRKRSWLVGGWVWDLANVRGAQRFFFAGPSSFLLPTKDKTDAHELSMHWVVNKGRLKSRSPVGRFFTLGVGPLLGKLSAQMAGQVRACVRQQVPVLKQQLLRLPAVG
jgi:hypothetical protein